MGVVALVLGVAFSVTWWRDRPATVGFAEDIKATSAECTSTESLRPGDAQHGLDLSCAMTDASPGNRDRPYVQVRLDGCDDWQRLDHDDGAEPVVITVDLEPCGTEPTDLQWQVCQTHGGPLPDDCDDGTTDLRT